MTWKEFQEQTRQITDAAAEKLGNATDLAVLRLQLRTEKMRLRSAYEEFGEIAYLSFTSEDEDGAEALAEYQSHYVDPRTDCHSGKTAPR